MDSSVRYGEISTSNTRCRLQTHTSDTRLRLQTHTSDS